jgi:hypothetical protein
MSTIATIVPLSKDPSFVAQPEWSYPGPTGSVVGDGEGISGFGIPPSAQAAAVWSGVQGKPFVTVSAIGQAQTGVINAGADFGPDTSGTTMNGLDSAIASGAGIIYVLNNGTHTWSPTGNVGGVQNGQIVVFEGGVTVNWTTAVGLIIGANAAGTTQYYHNVWIGNGAHIINKSSGQPGINIWGIMSYMDGFELDGNGAEYISLSMGYNTLTVYNCTASNIHTYNFTGPSGAIPLTTNNAANCAMYDCFADGSTVSSANDYSLLYVLALNGNTANCRYVRCRTKGNGASGQCLEVHGNTNGSTYSSQFITFEDCTFNSGATSPVGAGSGGAYLDDNNNGSSAAFINNITFSNCSWVNCNVSYQSVNNHFGYVRYEGGMPQGFSGSLLGRTPGQTTAITVGASPFTYTNDDGFLEDVVVSGGTVSAISIDGVTTGQTAGVFSLGAGHSLAVTYSAAPTMTKIPR